MPPYPAPDYLAAWPEARLVRAKTAYGGGLRRRWKDRVFIYEWDYRYGTVERYDLRGRPRGEFDADTGRQVGEPIASRRIAP